jgi:hypothetical protein
MFSLAHPGKAYPIKHKTKDLAILKRKKEGKKERKIDFFSVGH